MVNRTLDVGGDNRCLTCPFQKGNPFLGERGLRWGSIVPRKQRTQCAPSSSDRRGKQWSCSEGAMLTEWRAGEAYVRRRARQSWRGSDPGRYHVEIPAAAMMAEHSPRGRLFSIALTI